MWKQGEPIPLVKTSRKTTPNILLAQDETSKMAIAKRAVARLEEYDAATKPLIEAVNLAKEGRGFGSGGGDGGGRGMGRGEGERGMVERSRDPRLAGRNR